MSYPSLYFPGVPDFADGQTITVGNGTRLEYFDF